MSVGWLDLVTGLGQRSPYMLSFKQVLVVPRDRQDLAMTELHLLLMTLHLISKHTLAAAWTMVCHRQ